MISRFKINELHKTIMIPSFKINELNSLDSYPTIVKFYYIQLGHEIILVPNQNPYIKNSSMRQYTAEFNYLISNWISLKLLNPKILYEYYTPEKWEDLFDEYRTGLIDSGMHKRKFDPDCPYSLMHLMSLIDDALNWSAGTKLVHGKKFVTNWNYILWYKKLSDPQGNRGQFYGNPLVVPYTDYMIPWLRPIPPYRIKASQNFEEILKKTPIEPPNRMREYDVNEITFYKEMIDDIHMQAQKVKKTPIKPPRKIGGQDDE